MDFWREKGRAPRHTRPLFYLPRAAQGPLFSSLFVQEPFYRCLVVHEGRSRIFLPWIRVSGPGVDKIEAPLLAFFLDDSSLLFFYLLEECFDFHNPPSRLIGPHQAGILF